MINECSDLERIWKEAVVVWFNVHEYLTIRQGYVCYKSGSIMGYVFPLSYSLPEITHDNLSLNV
jgi:hypothetical protein